MRIDHLGKMWGQQTMLVNQPGAGGAIAARAAAAAAPDGYTLYMAIASTFISLPEIQPNLSFNVSDFVPIGFVGEVPMAIAIAPTLPVKSLPEFIAYSKTQIGGLNLAIPLRGGIPHLAAELFRERSGAQLTFIYYPGSPQGVQWDRALACRPLQFSRHRGLGLYVNHHSVAGLFPNVPRPQLRNFLDREAAKQADRSNPRQGRGHAIARRLYFAAGERRSPKSSLASARRTEGLPTHFADREIARGRTCDAA